MYPIHTYLQKSLVEVLGGLPGGAESVTVGDVAKVSQVLRLNSDGSELGGPHMEWLTYCLVCVD